MQLGVLALSVAQSVALAAQRARLALRHSQLVAGALARPLIALCLQGQSAQRARCWRLWLLLLRVLSALLVTHPLVALCLQGPYAQRAGCWQLGLLVLHVLPALLVSRALIALCLQGPSPRRTRCQSLWLPYVLVLVLPAPQAPWPRW